MRKVVGGRKASRKGRTSVICLKHNEGVIPHSALCALQKVDDIANRAIHIRDHSVVYPAVVQTHREVIVLNLRECGVRFLRDLWKQKLCVELSF